MYINLITINMLLQCQKSLYSVSTEEYSFKLYYLSKKSSL